MPPFRTSWLFKPFHPHSVHFLPFVSPDKWVRSVKKSIILLSSLSSLSNSTSSLFSARAPDGARPRPRLAGAELARAHPRRPGRSSPAPAPAAAGAHLLASPPRALRQIHDEDRLRQLHARRLLALASAVGDKAASLHAGALDVAVGARAAAAAPRHLLLLGRGVAGGVPAPRPSAWLTNRAHRRVKWSFHLSV